MRPPFLFHNPAFLNYQGKHFFKSAGGVGIAWFENDGKAISPLKAPFGSLFLLKENDADEETESLIQQMENHCRANNLDSVTLTHCPDAYQPVFSQKVKNGLVKSGFSILYQDLNFHIPVRDEFKKNLHRSERWKLNKAKREGYYFKKISPANWDLAYPILQESRIRKGYTLSMSRNSLEDAFAKFPGSYKMYGVFQNGNCAAIAITIEVSAGIEYIFYTADVWTHRKRSPVVLLHEGIYNECQMAKKQILDLGTASMKGELNAGVATFKKNLGGLPSFKNTYFKRLD